MKCLLCGNPPPLVEAQCHSCFAQRTELASLSTVVEVPYCPRCEALMFGAQWHDSPDLEKALERYLERAVTCHPQAAELELAVRVGPQDPYSRQGVVRVSGKVSEVKLEAQLECRLELRRQVCPPCSRQAGGYYEAVLQVRGLDRLKETHLELIQEYLEALLDQAAAADRNLFVAKQERVKGGLDYYLSSLGHARNLAKGLLRRFGGNSGESPRLMGRKEGRNLYRVTLVVRLLPFQRGDFLLMGKEPVRVLKLDGTRVVYRSLAYGAPEQSRVDLGQGGKVTYLGGSELVQSAQVVAWRGSEAEVLDPETFKVQVLVLPDILRAEAPAEIDIIRFDGRVYPVL